jgi:hypothetical protein
MGRTREPVGQKMGLGGDILFEEGAELSTRRGRQDGDTAPRIPEAQPSDPPLPTAAMLPSRETSNKNI